MIDTVIKGTTTIDEYKAIRVDMQQRAALYSNAHMSGCETWEHGNPVKCWYDTDKTFCIEYESGKWWHYRETAEGLQWW